jgi:hypothetical protein
MYLLVGVVALTGATSSGCGAVAVADRPRIGVLLRLLR